MEEPTLRPDGLGDLRDERDDVVVGGLLQLVDAVDVDPRLGLDRRERLLGDPAPAGLGAAHRQLHAEHVLEARLVRPDRAHLGQRVAPDHAPAPRAIAGAGGSVAAMSWRRWRPSQVIRSAAASAATRAPARSWPRPTTVRTRPPLVP